MYDVDVYLNVQKIPYKQKKTQTTKQKQTSKTKQKNRNLLVFYKAIRVIFPGFEL